jgi:autotransporter-associated beta strand protein
MSSPHRTSGCLFALIACSLVWALRLEAVGKWIALVNPAPDAVDTMLLLSDGRVMAANAGDKYWFQLTPDNHASYVSGTWKSLASMHDTRLYYSSDVLRDGRVFVAGGEYGTGKNTAEVYDPVKNQWTYTAYAWQSFSDSVSKILPDGRVLVAPVGPVPSGTTIIYDPISDSWHSGGKLYRGSYQDEASWVKLPDDSILTIDPFGTNSERYLPASNTWINDGVVPVALYDPYGGELGAAFLLADGRAFFLGSSGHTALYTPTGSTAPGIWTRGPDFPNGQGTPDAPAAMMVNGKILCVTSPKPTSSSHFPTPASFYEYDPVANSFTNVTFPTGITDLLPYTTRMLDLPDGTVLFSESSRQLYLYQPDGSPLAAGKPVISSISLNNDGSYHLVGSLLNGISEGAAYGDDAQMNSNYPLVRLTNSSGSVFYARTYNWSSTSTMTGNRPLSTEFTLPSNVAPGTFSLVVSANGNASDAVTFTTTVWNGTPTGDWDTTTTNWLKSGIAANFSQSDFVVFDDTAVGATNINLTMMLAPGGMFFNNLQTSYVLGGPGLLSGSGRLIKNGSGTLTLTETGGDNFSGGITVNKGTLILDIAGGAASGGMSIGPAALVMIGNNDLNGGIPSGNITNNGVLIFNQAADSMLSNAISGLGIFTKNNSNTLTLTGPNTWSGSTLVDGGTLDLAGAGSLAGTTNITITAGTTICVTNRVDGTLTLAAGQTLQGNGTIAGTLATMPESSVLVGTNLAAISGLTVLSNVVLQGELAMKIDSVLAVNDLLSASSITYGGILSLSNLSGAPVTLGASFRLFVASNYSGAFAAILPGIPAPGLAWNTNNLNKDGSLTVMFTPGKTWTGVSDDNWDGVTTNWSSSGSPVSYAQGDQVTFDDSVVGASSIFLTQALLPGRVTFNNSSLNYVFSGNGSLSLTNGLTKDFAGTVMLTETGGDDLSGGITLSNGTLILDNKFSSLNGDAFVGPGATLQLGLNDTNGAIPPGHIFLNGQLVLDRTDDLTLAQPIVGSGLLIKSNHNVVKVSQNNLNWTGAVKVAEGVLRIGSINALGSGTNVVVTAENGATLDINGIAGTNAVVASGAGADGNGAIVNNNLSSQALPGLAFLTLTGDTTIAGLNRWDLRPAGSNPDIAGSAFAGLSTGGQPYGLTKAGPNFVGIISAAIDPSLAYINVQSGVLDLEGDLPGLGNPNSALTVSSNAILEFRNLGTSVNKRVVLNDGATIINAAGANTLLGPITLSTNAAGSPGNCTFNVAGSYLWINAAPVGGSGNLIKTGTATLRLGGLNTYLGSTLINGGTLSLWGGGSITDTTNINIAGGATLKADDRSDKTLSLGNGQTLRGNGVLSGILLARAGSIIVPGADSSTLGSLTVSSNITLQANAMMKLNPASGTSDTLHGYSIIYGGTLMATNISTAPLVAGNSFHLFAATSYAGAFAAINPPTPGPGLQWDISKLVSNGTLAVTSLPMPGIASFSIAGSDLIINASNGVAGTLCSVLMSTNLASPIAQWTLVSSARLSTSGNFTQIATNSVDPGVPQRFYRLQVQ